VYDSTQGMSTLPDPIEHPLGPDHQQHRCPGDTSNDDGFTLAASCCVPDNVTRAAGAPARRPLRVRAYGAPRRSSMASNSEPFMMRPSWCSGSGSVPVATEVSPVRIDTIAYRTAAKTS
jgi:hypothetical protein